MGLPDHPDAFVLIHHDYQLTNDKPVEAQLVLNTYPRSTSKTGNLLNKTRTIYIHKGRLAYLDLQRFVPIPDQVQQRLSGAKAQSRHIVYKIVKDLEPNRAQQALSLIHI